MTPGVLALERRRDDQVKTLLITGGAGQIGAELRRLDWGANIRIVAPTRAELDITSSQNVAALFSSQAFDGVINASAYTSVDRAEDEAAAAFAANALGPALLADACRRATIPLIHISTDYVFAGDKTAPYVEDDAVGPLGVYGASKLAGELAVQSAAPRSVILRTAWVLSAHRSNFLKTMLRLSRTRLEIDVVNDQIGCPTGATDVARVIKTIMEAHLTDPAAPVGIYHFVNDGEASWCDLASVIFALDGDGAPRAVAIPITTDQYPTAARRPANSRLATAKVSRDFAVTPRPWRRAVADIIAELRADEQHPGAAA